MTEFTNQHLGLTDEEVLQSRSRHGDNVLTPPKRPSLWKLYLEKFEDPVVRVLLVAACFSLLISIFENEYAETIGIILNPDDIHIMKKSHYSGMFGDYSSYSAEYDELTEDAEDEEE